MPYDQWLMEGTAYKTQDNTLYIQKYATLDQFQWMGNCARIDDGEQPLGDIATTRKRSPNGGTVVDDASAGIPDTASTSVVMKKLQADRKKTDLKRCWWTLDDREMCGGKGSDYWNRWEEITRYCQGRATGRTINATSFGEEEEADRMVTMPFGFVSVVDMYRVTGEIDSTADTEMWMDVAAFQPERCPDACDDEEGCIVVAITEDDSATPHAVISYDGGDHGSWGAQIALTAFGVNDATQIAGARHFGVVTCVGDSSLIVTQDLFATQTNIATADMTAHAPTSVDLIDQSFVVVGGADGYVFGSGDGGVTWRTLSEGGATTNAITRIQIARSNPQVIYAVSSADDVCIKSENGGRTWYAQALTTSAGGLTALWVDPRNHNNVIVGTDLGEVYATTDGAQTWVEQSMLPGLTAATKPNTTIADIVGCGCGDLGLITENSSDDARLFLRNVDNGADGRWFQPAEYEAVTSGKSLTGLTCCGPNHFLAVGGEAGTDDLILLLE
jgi:hypothetical protein